MKSMLLLCLVACLLVAYADAGTIKYKVVRGGYPGRYSYLTADAKCSQMGKGWTLAMPKKQGQNNVITNLAKNKTPPTVPFWIGLDDIGQRNAFFWKDGRRLGKRSWSNWATNEPNTTDGPDCVKVDSSGKWSVEPCHDAMSFICQKKTG